MNPVVTDIPRLRPSPVQWLVAALGCLYYLAPLLTPKALSAPPGAPLMALLLLPAVLSLVALWALLRRPVALAGVLALLWLVGPAVFGPALVAQEQAARTLRHRTSVATALALVAAKLVVSAWTFATTPHPAVWVECFLSCVGIVLATLVGWLRLSTAGERAGRLEAQAARQEAWEARVNEARLAERERIAREMHDVVAHRISLIAMHSGALAHRMKDSEPGGAELAGLIQANAKASLSELRGMLASLRGTDAPPEPPQPTLAVLDALVGEARSAGQSVSVRVSGDLAGLPERVSRNAYRIVQEGLTNARRHAPGAPTEVAVRVADDLLLRVVNPLADLAEPDRSGSGLGLVGVVERVEQLGGDVTHGLQGADFVLQARIPLAGTGSGGS